MIEMSLDELVELGAVRVLNVMVPVSTELLGGRADELDKAAAEHMYEWVSEWLATS